MMAESVEVQAFLITAFLSPTSPIVDIHAALKKAVAFAPSTPLDALAVFLDVA